MKVELEVDSEPRVVAEPADFARALSADPIARTRGVQKLCHCPRVQFINSIRRRLGPPASRG
jgi:hypothetical protein